MGDNKARCTKATIVDFQANVSEEIKKEIHDYWAEREFGNDYYYEKFNDVGEFEVEWEGRFPAISEHLKSLNIEGPILIHWWW